MQTEDSAAAGKPKKGTLAFLAAFLRKPFAVGSVTPSSKALSDAIVEEAGLVMGSTAGRTVVELGAGTGPITSAIVRVAADATFVAFEPDPDLAAICRRRFPGVDLREELAGPDLGEKLAASGVGPVDHVVSGLPFTAWPAEVQAGVLDGVVSALAPGGRFVTYSYAWRSSSKGTKALRAALDARFERTWTSPVVWWNVPPAYILCAEGPRKG